MILILTLLLWFPPRVTAWAPEPRMMQRDANYGAFLDIDPGDNMLEVRAPPKSSWQVPLPAHNALRQHQRHPQANHPDYGAFFDIDPSDRMLEDRAPPKSSWQVPLPAHNELRSRRPTMLGHHKHSSSSTTKHQYGDHAERILFESRNHLPGYDLAVMNELNDIDLPADEGVKTMFFKKKSLLPDTTTDVFGRDDDEDVRSKLEEMDEDLDDFKPPEEMEVHTKKIYFESHYKLPDHHYGSDL